ncbi:hypothetical protein D3C76_257000 [compost metagenome]
MIWMGCYDRAPAHAQAGFSDPFDLRAGSGKLAAYMNLLGGTFPEKRPGRGCGTPERKNPLKSAINLAGDSDIQGVVKQALACEGL